MVTNSAGRNRFGRLPNGAAVDAVTLRNGWGLAARILTYGGIIAALDVPDKAGQAANVVLGFDTLESYSGSTAYIGAIIGRYANRISGGRFELDGVDHHVCVNEPPNALHGGAQGFDRAVWHIDSLAAGDEPSVQLSHISAAGDQGFPGRLAVQARYRLRADALQLDFEAATDRPTVVNLTNHSYFNLAGAGTGDVLGHELMIVADRFTPIDRTLIPTGDIRPVDGTPFDFRTAAPIGARIRAASEQLAIARGYDHNFVLRGARDSGPALAARVREPRSGRVMEVWTTEPGLQFYSGNFLTGSDIGAGGRLYRQSDGFCLETQHFPDAPNQPHFPSTVLRPGATFSSTTRFRFAADSP